MGKSKIFGDFQFSKPIVRLPLLIKKRAQGSRIESIPLRRLIVLSNCGFRSWCLEECEGGLWLVLEAL